MLLKRSLPVFAVFGVVVLGGCLNLLFPFAPDQTAETLLRANCKFAFNCCLAAERNQVGIGISSARDEATCIEQGLEVGGDETLLGQRVQAAIAAGNAEHNAALAEKCLKPLVDAANSCDAQAFLRPAADAECARAAERGFATGKVGDGDDCTDDIECADEGRCIRNEADEGEVVISLAGKCAAGAAEGKDCSENFLCQAGLQCQFAADGATCEKIVLLDDGESCFDGSDCESGVCIEVQEAGFCFETDEPCNDDEDCGDDDFCDSDFNEVCGAADDVKVEICDGK